MNYKFPKSEKLRLKKDLENLFQQGNKMFRYPVSLIYLPITGPGKNLCAVSVPKRRFKKAVDRNRIKRQMREAYRLNKHKIMFDNKHFHMMFVYSISEKLDYNKIEKAVIKLMNDISK
jgi:ribonuclease P protein component